MQVSWVCLLQFSGYNVGTNYVSVQCVVHLSLSTVQHAAVFCIVLNYTTKFPYGRIIMQACYAHKSEWR